MEFSAGAHMDGAVWTIALLGEVDLVAVGAVRELIADGIAAGVEVMRFDMRDVTFCGSTGVNLVMHAWRAGLAVEVVGCVPAVRRVFEIAGADQLVRLRID